MKTRVLHGGDVRHRQNVPKEDVMKRTIFVLSTMLVVFVAVFAVLVLRPIRKVKADHHGCSNETLRGDYLWRTFGGTNDIPSQPFSIVSLVRFDGKGNYSTSEFFEDFNGYVEGPGSPPGTYDISSDCAVTMRQATLLMHGVVDTNGGEVLGDMETSGGILQLTGTTDIRRRD
jgi:hypothetical protein